MTLTPPPPHRMCLTLRAPHPHPTECDSNTSPSRDVTVTSWTVTSVCPGPSSEESAAGSVPHSHSRNGTYSTSEDISDKWSTKQRNVLIIGLSVPILILVLFFAVYYFGRKLRRSKPQTPPADEAQKDADEGSVTSAASSSSGNPCLLYTSDAADER